MKETPLYTFAIVFLGCIALSFSKPTQKELSKECKEPIGIQTGFLEDRDVKTSTQQKNFTISDAWCSTQNNDKQFFAVDLGEDFLFTKVATQGKVDDKNRFVKSYELQFSNDNKEWKTYLDGKKTALDGNKDTFTVKYHKLAADTIGRYVKLVPKSWNNGICSRLELYGCAVEDLKKPQTKDKIKEKSPAQVPEKAAAQVTEPAPAQVTEPAPAQAQESAPAQAQESAPAQQVQESALAQTQESTPAQATEQAPGQVLDVKEVVPNTPNAKEVPKRDSEANWNIVNATGNNEAADAGAADNADLLELSRQLGTPTRR